MVARLMCACSPRWIRIGLISGNIFFRYLDTHTHTQFFTKDSGPNFSRNSINLSVLNLHVQAIVIFGFVPKRSAIFHTFERFISPYVLIVS